MNIRYHVTFDDFIATYQINVKGNPSTAMQRMKVLLLLLAITVVCICLALLIRSNLPLYLAAFVVFFTLLVLILSQMKSVVGKNLARFFDIESQKRLAGPRECVIDENGFVVRSIYCDTHFYWPAITRIETTNGYLLFFMGTILATYIPQVNVESKTFTTFKESAIQFWQSAKDNPLEPLPL